MVSGSLDRLRWRLSRSRIATAMKITHDMGLDQLAALMGPNATRDDAAVMRDALIGAGHADTDQVSRSDWLTLLDLVVAGDAAVHAADAAIAESLARGAVVVRLYSDALDDEVDVRSTVRNVKVTGHEYSGETADCRV